MNQGDPKRRAAVALEKLGARAAGIWALEGNSLVQLAFEAAPDMPEEIAHNFADATQIVPTRLRDLGIVLAAVEGRTTVSIASELDPRTGSGYWLLAFGADRSVAVPRFDPSGNVIGVFSVAMPRSNPDADTVRSILEAIDRDQG